MDLPDNLFVLCLKVDKFFFPFDLLRSFSIDNTTAFFQKDTEELDDSIRNKFLCVYRLKESLKKECLFPPFQMFDQLHKDVFSHDNRKSEVVTLQDNWKTKFLKPVNKPVHHWPDKEHPIF